MSMAPYMYRVAASAIGHPRSGGAQVAIARGAAGGATGRVGAGGRGPAALTLTEGNRVSREAA